MILASQARDAMCVAVHLALVAWLSQAATAQFEMEIRMPGDMSHQSILQGLQRKAKAQNKN